VNTKKHIFLWIEKLNLVKRVPRAPTLYYINVVLGLVFVGEY
jgi:hypothetical protein